MKISNFIKRKQTLYWILEVFRRQFYKKYLKDRKVKFSYLKIYGKPLILNRGKIKIGNGTNLVSSEEYYGEDLPKVSLNTINENSSLEIGENCTLNGTSIRCAEKIQIGNNCVFASGVKIIDHDHHLEIEKRHNKEYPRKEIIIEDNVWIGFNTIILKGVKIGENSVVGAGSIVTKDIPKNVVVAGSPAKVIKML